MAEATETKTPRERFLSVAPGRVQKVLDALDHLAKCGNAKPYEFTEDEVNEIGGAIGAKLVELDAAFKPPMPAEPRKFAFLAQSDGGESTTS